MAKRIVDEEMRFTVVVNGNAAQKELYELEQANRKLKSANTDLRKERAQLFREGKKGTAEYKALTDQINKNSVVIGANAKRMDALQKEIGITGLSLNQLRRRAAILGTQLRNMIPGSADFNRIQAELRQVTARMRELQAASRNTEGSLSKLAGGFNKYAALGASVIATATGIVLSLQKMIDFNGKLSDAQADVMKTTNMTKEEVDALSRSFGMMKTRTARTELLNLATEAGRLGITGTKNIQDFVEVANKMKVALGDILSDEEIREVGKLTTVYQVGAKTGKDFKDSMEALGSALNEVGATGANTEKFLVNYLKRQAGVAVQAKVSAADNIGYAATFDEIGQSVEVSATAMNKVWMDMFKNTGTYADIAGMSLEDFTELLNTDSNEAMLRFLEGLNGNNEGLSVMVEKLSDLEVGGARGAQALSAISAHTERLRTIQKTSNQALEEATSLSDEYNIKNNNLAATLDKVRKQLMGAFASPIVIGGLSGLVNWFAKLIGAVDNTNKAFEQQTKTSFENATASRRLAQESENLLREYESLTKDGIEPTADEKDRLQMITLHLRDRLGESVVAIDKETGAFRLNTEAVREQIKAKTMAADEEAATMASRLYNTNEEIKNLQERRKPLENEYNLRKKYFEEQNAETIDFINNLSGLTAFEKLAMKERLDGYKEMDRALSAYKIVNSDIEEQERRRLDLKAKLAELNYTESDVNALFAGPDVQPETACPSTGTGSTSSGDNRKRLIDQINKDILAATRAAEDARLALLEDKYLEELAQMQFAHDRKMADLRAKLTDEETLRQIPASLRAEYEAAINQQIESETEAHQFKQATLIQKGLAQQFAQEEDQYNREKTLRQTKFAEELAAYAGNEEAQAELRENYNKEELEAEARHLNELIRQFNEMMGNGSFGGFDLELLTPSQKAEMEKILEDLRLKLAEVVAEKKKLSSNGEGASEGDTAGIEGLGDGADTDLLGYSMQDWQDLYDNFNEFEYKMRSITMSVEAMQTAFAMYYRFMNEEENRHLKEYEKTQNKEKTALKNRLDAGLINQRQYDQALAAMEADMDKRKADLEYKQAKRAWQLQLTNAIATAAMATINGFNTAPFFPLGIIMGALAATLGTIQVGMIAKNKPVKGYEEGLYPDWLFPVEREQDGKMFNARYGGKPKSGMVKDPTILVGEMPELIISNPDLKKFNPEVIASIGSEIKRVRGYESGYTGPSVQNSEIPTAPQTDNTALLALVAENIAVLRELRENGVAAYLVRDMENSKKIQDDLDRLRKYRLKSQI